MYEVAKIIRKAINKIPEDNLFGYKDLPMFSEKGAAVMQTMYRLLQEGKIKRFKKGIFYRPQKGHDGKNQLPSIDIVVEDLLRRDGEKIGYITGVKLYNSLGLTTQYSFVFEIASHIPIPSINFKNRKIRVVRVKSYVAVTKKIGKDYNF